MNQLMLTTTGLERYAKTTRRVLFLQRHRPRID
jgi:hypothetical protein